MSFGDLQKTFTPVPPREEFRIFIDDQDAVTELAKLLKRLLREQDPLGARPVNSSPMHQAAQADTESTSSASSMALW